MVATRSTRRSDVSNFDAALQSPLPVPQHLPFSAYSSTTQPLAFSPSFPPVHAPYIQLQTPYQPVSQAPAQVWPFVNYQLAEQSEQVTAPLLKKLKTESKSKATTKFKPSNISKPAMSSSMQAIVAHLQQFITTTNASLDQYKPLLNDTATLKESVAKLKAKVGSQNHAKSVGDEIVANYGKLGTRIDELESKLADMEYQTTLILDDMPLIGASVSRPVLETGSSGAEDSAYGSEDDLESKKARIIQLDACTELDLNTKLTQLAHAQHSLGSALSLTMDELTALRERQDFMEERDDEHLEKLDRKIAAM